MSNEMFSVAAVLTVISGRLLCEFSEVHALLDYLTGQRLYTHQLPRASEAVTPALTAQHPRIANIAVPPFDGPGDIAEQVSRFVDAIADGVGTHVQVTPVPEAYSGMNPIAELVQMREVTP